MISNANFRYHQWKILTYKNTDNTFCYEYANYLFSCINRDIFRESVQYKASNLLFLHTNCKLLN